MSHFSPTSIADVLTSLAEKYTSVRVSSQQIIVEADTIFLKSHH
jgi:hypothetical protein